MISKLYRSCAHPRTFYFTSLWRSGVFYQFLAKWWYEVSISGPYVRKGILITEIEIKSAISQIFPVHKKLIPRNIAKISFVCPIVYEKNDTIISTEDSAEGVQHVRQMANVRRPEVEEMATSGEDKRMPLYAPMVPSRRGEEEEEEMELPNAADIIRYHKYKLRREEWGA